MILNPPLIQSVLVVLAGKQSHDGSACCGPACAYYVVSDKCITVTLSAFWHFLKLEAITLVCRVPINVVHLVHSKYACSVMCSSQQASHEVVASQTYCGTVNPICDAILAVAPCFSCNGQGPGLVLKSLVEVFDPAGQ